MLDTENSIDTESNPAPGRRKRKWIGAFILAGLAVAAIPLLSRPSIDIGPTSVPVAVDSRDGFSEQATLVGAVGIAREGLERMDRELIDYVGRMIKRERIDGILGEPVEMEFKIRVRRPGLPGGADSPVTPAQPMSVYLKFLKPASSAGREVIWVEGENSGNLIAHEAGIANLFRISLDPAGYLAMRGNRYPITEIGFENLVRQLIARSEAIRETGGAEVTYVENYEVGDRLCLLIQVRPQEPSANSPSKDPATDFWLAEIAIDTDRGVPLRYAAYGAPQAEGESPPLLEEYTYLDVRLNVGLTDADFDPDNPQYNFP